MLCDLEVVQCIMHHKFPNFQQYTDLRAE